MKRKVKSISSCHKTVNLLVDEIRLKLNFDFKGGDIVEAARNSTDAANSEFAFMITSLFSNFEDVVHVLPAYRISAQDLQYFLHKTIIGSEVIGFTVVSVIMDNNAINNKAMSLFANPAQLSIVYPHPSDKNRPQFFYFT